MRLGQTIPALPARDVSAAAEFYRDRLAFELADGNLVTFFER